MLWAGTSMANLPIKALDDYITVQFAGTQSKLNNSDEETFRILRRYF